MQTNIREVRAAVEAGRKSLVKGANLKALAMVAYSQEVFETLGVTDLYDPAALVESFDSARTAGRVKAAVRDVGARLLPGFAPKDKDALSYDDVLHPSERIAGIWGALVCGNLREHPLTPEGAFRVTTVNALRTDFQRSDVEHWKLKSGRPKTTEAETTTPGGGVRPVAEMPGTLAAGSLDLSALKAALESLAGQDPAVLSEFLGSFLPAELLVSAATHAELREQAPIDVDPPAAEASVQATPV